MVTIRLKKIYKSISVGALNNYLDDSKNQTKAWYSNSGSAIDCFAPADGTLAASGNSNTDEFPRYDSQFYYSWLSKNVFDRKFNGTSAACPSASGWISTVLSRITSWGEVQAQSYIKNIVKIQPSSSIEEGFDPGEANSVNFNSYENIFDGDIRIVYNETIGGIPLNTNLPSTTDIPASRDLTLKIVPSAQYVITYNFQWQKSYQTQGGFTDISGETSPTLTLENISNSEIGVRYRCKIDSDGPYLTTYSNATQLLLTLDDIKISTQPASVKILKGSSGSIAVDATGDPSITLGFQWQKLNTTTNKWEDIANATKSTLGFPNASSSSVGSYRCIISDPLKFVTSKVASVAVFESTISFTQTPENKTVFKGANAIFEVKAVSTGNSNVTYFWQSSSKQNSGYETIKGATLRTLVLNDVEISDGKYYKCTAQDSVSSNSPITTPPIKLTVQAIAMNVESTPPLSVSALEGEEATISIRATINDGTRPSFRFEKRETLNGSTFWRLFQTNDTGEILFSQVPKSFEGRYRCIISDPTENNSDVIFKPIDIIINPSFTVGSVASSPSLAEVDNKITLTPDVRIINPSLSYSYLWQRRESSSDEWTNIYSATEKKFEFTFTGADFGDQFRCKVSNSLGSINYSDTFTISADPFVDIVKDLQDKISFKERSQVEHTLDPEVVSTHPNAISYQWQKSLDKKSTWSDISGQTNKKLELTPSNIAEFNSGNTDDFYHLRLKITFTQTTPSTVIYSNATLIDLLDAISLFGDGLGACLTQDQADELYNTDLTDSRTAHGNASLPDRQYIETINVDPIDPKDKCKDKNTCGISIEELFDKYPIYNTQKGLYKSWGDIEFPWQLEEARNPSGVTCNLNDAETDDKWQIAKYKALYAYFPKIGSGGLSSPPNATCLTERPADRVLRIEDDGYKVSLYEAIDLVPALSGPFDYSKWKKICHVITSIPAGLPTPKEIKERYQPFELDMFLENWAEYAADWSENFYQQNFDDCRSNNSLLADVEKCMKKKDGPFGESSDEWQNARIKKEFFYKVGDYAYLEGECKDTVCLYINVRNIPATEANFKIHKNFPKVVDGVTYWRKVYCVATGVNKCLEPQGDRDLPNYQLVEIGSKGHYVEQPLPYYKLKGNTLCNDFELLNEYVEQEVPKVLTQEEIDALDQPT